MKNKGATEKVPYRKKEYMRGKEANKEETYIEGRIREKVQIMRGDIW